MIQKNILKLAGGIALIVAGLLLIFIGFIVALFAGAEWLLASLMGLVSVIGGGLVISSEVKQVMKKFKGSPRHVRSRIKK